MRIAHVITRLILGGAQENTLLCCEDLIRRYGDDVLLITGPPLGPEGSLLDRARAGGVPVEIIDSLRRPIHPWRDSLSYFQLKKILRRYRPDVVHTHSAKGGMLGRAAAWSLKAPAVVHTVHGAPFHPWQGRGARRFFRLCERWAARRCHALVSVADAMTDLMVEARVAPREKFLTVYSGMEVEPFLKSDEHRRRVRRELGYSDEHVVIGKIARLFKLKGHDDVIRAAERMIAGAARNLPSPPNLHPMGEGSRFHATAATNVRFLFVGDGIYRRRLERQIAAAGLSDYFRFTGLVPPERIPELISAMDIVVHASLREGLARVLPQALISARPAVSYDVDGAKEVVIDGKTGFLAPPRDLEGLSSALRRLVADEAMRERFGQEGRRRFTDVFRHERMTEQLRALYVRICEAGPTFP
ncbi:MAG: glycosyltransferase family 4 protein [Pirellulales bacterium]|nr:glycosyltransferase family 4 protein [Pirellulales bacterium]